MLPTREPQAERLALLSRLAQSFNSSLDLDVVLNRVMDEVIAAVRAERGFVMLRDPVGKLAFKVARGIDRRIIEDPSFQISRGVVERVALDGKPVLTSDAQQDDRFSMRQSIVSLGLRAIMCAPLVVRGAVIGVVYADNRLQAGVFAPGDLELFSAIASSAAIAIENARLYEAAVEKGRLERELQMARELQAGLLPAAEPRIEGWEILARWIPARQVSGDYYDFLRIERDGSEAIGIVVADVADKGMAAAIFMALTRSTIRASLLGTARPADAIARANRLICDDAHSGMFVSLFYAELEAATGRLTYVNAGHNPPYHVCAGDEGMHLLTRTGLVLGVDAEAEYTQVTVQLEPGDHVYIYTDGIVEAVRGPAGSGPAPASFAATEGDPVMFGDERLAEIIGEYRHGAAAQALFALDRALREFTGPVAPFDDMTIVGVRRTPAGSSL